MTGMIRPTDIPRKLNARTLDSESTGMAGIQVVDTPDTPIAAAAVVAAKVGAAGRATNRTAIGS